VWGFSWNDFLAIVRDYLNTGNDTVPNDVPNNSMSSDDIPIINPATASYKQAEAWARSLNGTDTFISLARKYWDYAPFYGNVNPVIAYCQAALETGYGKFKGVLDESYKNPCGMKTDKGGSDTDPDAHQRFMSWEDGVKAHLEHLALYAGAAGYPLKNGYDPRHFPYLLGTGKTLKTMSAGWCPGNPNYATLLKGMMDKLAVTKTESTPEKPAPNMPTPEEIISVLAGKVNIASPDYWVNVLAGRETANLDYLNTLFARFAGFDT
jgi:hypothetical protein